MQYAKSIERLLTIMDQLRTQCPWDRKQTLQSLRPQTLEEIYELTEAIADEDWTGIKEEMGDVLLHLTFYSKIASEQGRFEFVDVIEGICNKLVSRHPHIYAGIQVENEEEVKKNWEQLKLKEGKKSVLSGVPKTMPAMIKALRLQEKSKQFGFEWNNISDVRKKVAEELEELDEAVVSAQHSHIEDELGDVLFAMINYARFAGVDPEHALERTNQKFIRRFQYIESHANNAGKSLNDMSLEEMDRIWEEAKKKEKQL